MHIGQATGPCAASLKAVESVLLHPKTERGRMLMSYTINYFNPIEDEIQTSSDRYDTTGLGSKNSQEPNDRQVQATQRVISLDSPKRTYKHALNRRDKIQ
jgi:hypothetical protein